MCCACTKPSFVLIQEDPSYWVAIGTLSTENRTKNVKNATWPARCGHRNEKTRKRENEKTRLPRTLLAVFAFPRFRVFVLSCFSNLRACLIASLIGCSVFLLSAKTIFLLCTFSRFRVFVVFAFSRFHVFAYSCFRVFAFSSFSRFRVFVVFAFSRFRRFRAFVVFGFSRFPVFVISRFRVFANVLAPVA